MLLRRIAVGALLVSSFAAAGAADCTLRGASGVSDSRLTYKQREGDRRCEGLYQARVSESGSVTLVSLTTAPLQWSPGTKPVVTMMVPGATRELEVHAVPLPRAVYYRMDGALRPQAVFRWPIGEVLAQTSLRSSDVGVLASYRDGSSTVYVPLSFSATPTNRLIAMFQNPRPMERVRWRILEASAGRCSSPSGWQTGSVTMIADGRVARIDLNPPRNEFCLEVLGTEAMDRPAGGTARIHVKP